MSPIRRQTAAIMQIKLSTNYSNLLVCKEILVKIMFPYNNVIVTVFHFITITGTPTCIQSMGHSTIVLESQSL
jgi:hypothetical protein